MLEEDLQALGVFERRVLRTIFGGVQEDDVWRRRMNHELVQLYGEPSIQKVYFADAGSPPTKHMPNSASKTLFYRDVDSTYPFWRLNRRMSARRKPKTNAKRLETDIEGCQFLAEKTDRRELIDLLKRLLTIDHERNRPLAHLVDSSFYNNVKAPNDGGVP
ncbi:homeodomain-interacting protein kinase 2-like isoform X2 [Armigeres subalbatus]|uniref:homeodomain-interacting protein kinase 2-like isoform X2 n=1 Tax=Armigeres subalbatus TaxID=124917 RepID=UPI002ED3CE20